MKISRGNHYLRLTTQLTIRPGVKFVGYVIRSTDQREREREREIGGFTSQDPDSQFLGVDFWRQ